MRSKRLVELEALGFNVPIFTIVDEEDFERSKKFKKKCAVRFDILKPIELFEEVLKRIDTKELIIERGTPPFIPHMSPCKAYHLFKGLKELGASFKAHVTDVTVKDSVGAGMSINLGNEIVIEAVSKGTVREISRKGRVEVRAKYIYDRLVLMGSPSALLGYCIFRSAELISRLPNALIEWSCHKGRWGVLGDHLIIWELYKVKSRDSNY